MTKNEARTEIKYLLNNISLTDEAEAIDEILSLPLPELQEEIDYFRRIKDQAAQAERTTSGDEYLKYRHRRESLTQIMDLIYLYF